MPAIVRQQPFLSATAVASVMAFAAFGAVRGKSETLIYVLVVSAAMAFVARLYARVPVSPTVLWGLAAWGAAHMAGGLIGAGDGVLYNQRIGVDVIRFDRIVHAVGFGFAAAATWQVMRTYLRPEQQVTWGVAALVWLAGMGIGALNEVLEFGATHVGTGANVGGYDNTGWDLVSNMIGSAVAAVVARGAARRARATT